MSKVIKASSAFPGDWATQPYRIVLHETNRGELVTHQENLTKETLESKPQRDYYWGHYFKASEMDAAVKDFNGRCEAHGLNPEGAQ